MRVIEWVPSKSTLDRWANNLVIAMTDSLSKGCSPDSLSHVTMYTLDDISKIDEISMQK